MKKIFTALTFVLISVCVIAQLRIYTPEQVAPENGATGEQPNAYVDWNAVTGGTYDITYEMWLDTDPSFPNPLTINTSNSAYQTNDLYFGQTYYWKVRATDGDTTSYWSETWSFTVLLQMELKSPSNNSSKKEPETQIKWDTVSGVLAYQVQYDTSFYWENHLYYNDEDLNDVSTIDMDHAFAVGNAGLIMYYMNGKWLLDESYDVNDDLFAVDFLSSEVGFVGGENGLLLSYNAGGWEEIQIDDGGSPYTGDVLSLVLISDVFGMAGCEGGDIALWDGANWGIEGEISDDVVGLSALNETMIWAACTDGSIYKYDGVSWTEEYAGGDDLFGIGMTNENHGWAVGEKGTLVSYNGTNWELVEAFTNDDFLALAVVDDMSAYLFGDDENIFNQTPAGWMNVTSGTKSEIYGASVGMDGSGWAVGEEGAILKFNGTAFNSPFTHVITYPAQDQDTMLYDLPYGKNIYWRMRAMHVLDTTEWSFPFAFQTYDTVELKAPIDTAKNQALRIKFRWGSLDGSTGYNVQIDSDPAFSNPVEYNVDSVSVFGTVGKFATMYYWRVKAYHNHDQSSWNPSPYRFTTINQVVLEEPGNGEMQVVRLPRFEWDSIPGVPNYRIQYNTTPDFTSPCCDEVILDGTPHFQVTYILEENQDIYWRVKAITTDDSTDWSEIWHFTTEGGIGIEETLAGNVSVYPNPTKESVYLEFNLPEPAKIRLVIMDLLGQSFIDQELSLSDGLTKERVDVNGLSNGVYLVRIEKDGEIYTEKLIVDN